MVRRGLFDSSAVPGDRSHNRARFGCSKHIVTASNPIETHLRRVHAVAIRWGYMTSEVLTNINRCAWSDAQIEQLIKSYRSAAVLCRRRNHLAPLRTGSRQKRSVARPSGTR